MKQKIIHLIKSNQILTLILLLAVLLRFIGIYPGYHPYHSDEGMSYSSAMEMIRNLTIDPGRYDYPALIPLINAFLYVTLFIPIFLVKNFIFDPDNLPTKGRNIIELWQQVVIQNQQTDVLFWGRFVTAAFGVGIVFLVYLVVKRFFQDRRIGLVAAFLTAVNFRQVLNSHLGLPDIYNSFFLLLAFYFFAILLRNPKVKNYLAAGFITGLFFSTKLQIFALSSFLVTHVFIAWERASSKKLKNLIKNFLEKRFLVSLLVIPIIIVLINPYHLIKWEEFKAVEGYNLLKYRLGTNMLNIFPISYLYHVGIGKTISLFTIFGAILSLLKYPKATLILLSVVLPFLYFFFYYSGGGYYTRNFVTITPILIIFASIFLVNILDYLGRRVKLKPSTINILLFISVIFISSTQIKNSLVTVYYFSKPWGFKEAHDWAQKNIPPSSKVVSHPWDNYPRDKNLEIIPFETSEVFSLAEMQEEGADFGFINMDWLTLGSYWWMNRDTKTSLAFWEKPNELLSNAYSSIVAQELARFTVVKFIKPWQAPDMNFLVVKVPNVPKIGKKVLLSNFDFDQKDELSSWSLIDGDWADVKKIFLDNNVGKNSLGSLKIENGSRILPVVLAMSPMIPIKNYDRAYIVEEWIKSGTLLDKKVRDGAIRVDFFENDPGKIGIKTKSLERRISSRFFGGTDWTKKELIIFPPKKAKFMSVGFQINNFTDFWIDDIKVYVSSDAVENPRDKEKYIDYQIPDDILFPYSQGGL